MYQQIWKDIPTWQGIYQCSNYGRVFNLKSNKFVAIFKDEKGYSFVGLYSRGRSKKWRLHRLIATVFQRPLLKTEDAHHKNGWKWCNCSSNIEIIDHKQHCGEHNRKKAHLFRGKKRPPELVKRIIEIRKRNKLLKATQ